MEIQRITIPYAQLAQDRPLKTFMIRAIKARQDREERNHPHEEPERDARSPKQEGDTPPSDRGASPEHEHIDVVA